MFPKRWRKAAGSGSRLLLLQLAELQMLVILPQSARPSCCLPALALMCL